MSYADILIENAKEISPAIFEQVISDAVYDACMVGGQEVFEAFETYAKILADKTLEPQEDFEESLDEVFTPFFENAASIYGGMLLETDAFTQAVKAPSDAIQKTHHDSVTRRIKAAAQKEALAKSPTKRFMRDLRKGTRKTFNSLKKGISSGLARAKDAASKSYGAAKSKVGAASKWIADKKFNIKNYGKVNPSKKFALA